MWSWRKRSDEDFAEEIRSNVTLETDRLIADGMSPNDARSAALRTFGNVTRAQERFHELGRVRWLDARRLDIGYASRMLVKNPGFTTVVMLTLALGIGATTAIFAIVDAVFLKPLPYQHTERLLALGSNAFGFGGGNTGQTFLFLKDRLASFSRIAASRDGNGWNLVVNQRAEYVRALLVTPGYFEVFGTQPLYGREFSEAEGQVNGPLAVVLSEALWRRVFAARPEAIGTIVRLGGAAHTVVGVMPASFHSIPTVDVWTPLRLAPGDNALNYSISGRLRDDRSIGQAANELDALKPTIVTELATTNGNFPDRINRLGWVPYRATVTGPSRPVIQVLLGGAVLVLLAACANVAALQLIRTTVRRRELAIRAALGGGPSRSAWHLLTESSILGLLGAAVGTAVATGALSYVHPLLSESFLAGQTPSINLRVLAAAAGMGLLTSVVFGGWPALDAARLNLSDALSSGSRTVTSGKRTSRIRRLLVAGQVGIAATLLVTAGLFARAVIHLTNVDAGFDPKGVVTAQSSLQGVAAGSAIERRVFFERILQRLREVPGVEAVAVGSNVPIGRTFNLALEPAGNITDPRGMDWVYASPDYFSVFSIGVRAGRVFGASDDITAMGVAIINEAFARAYFGSPAAAVGQQIQLLRAIGDNPRVIVGVVADVRAASGAGWTSGHPLATPASPTVYVPATQVPDGLAQIVHGFVPVHWALKVRGNLAAVAVAIQAAMRDAAPQLPVIQVTTMESIIADAVALQRTLLLVLGLFAAVTLSLAMIGIYGVVAYSVAMRRHEIGVRLALGATMGRVLRGFVREGMATALVGATVGLSVAAALSGVLTGFVIGISPLDPSTYLTAVMLVVGLAALVSLIPSARAATVSAADALRTE
jgi:putative ABC transport system permease protein